MTQDIPLWFSVLVTVAGSFALYAVGFYRGFHKGREYERLKK